MNTKKSKDGIGNHPESQKLKDICDISPQDDDTKHVCKKINQYRKEKSHK